MPGTKAAAINSSFDDLKTILHELRLHQMRGPGIDPHDLGIVDLKA